MPLTTSNKPAGAAGGADLAAQITAAVMGISWTRAGSFGLQLDRAAEQAFRHAQVQEAVSAALASTARAGAGDWVTVPREPTEEMRRAFEFAFWRKADDVASPTPTEFYEDGGGPFGYGYSAMIEAAPAVPASPISTGEEEDEAAAERRHVRETELQEIQDGAYGDGPMTRGLARKALKASREASPPAPAEHGVEIRELSEKATPGPWRAGTTRRDSPDLLERSPKVPAISPDRPYAGMIWRGTGLTAEDDAAFIVALVNAYRSGELIHPSETGGQGAGREGEGRDLERVRHLKRGTEYEVLGEAEAQVSKGASTRDGKHHRCICDDDRLTVYRCLKTGKLWCRFTDEFRDGRFVPSPTDAKTGEV